MASRLNSPLVVVLLVATLVGLFVLGRLHQGGFDLSSFIVAGDQFSNPTKVPAGLTVLPNSPGYDGQFYYRLALDPLTAKATDFGITLDTPPFRQQRILYPLVCGIFSAGDPRLLPAVMILVNVIALCAMAWIGANYARAFDVHALWGAFLPLHPAFLFSLTRNLVEILEVSLLLGSLLLLRRGRPLLATLSLSLAVLTKETALLVAVAAMVAYGWQWWRTTSAGIIRWYYFAVPVALFILWRGFLSLHWGSFAAYSSGNSLLGLPFVGPVSFLFEMASFETKWHRRMFIELLFLLVFAVGVAISLRSSKLEPVEKLSWLLYAMLAACLSRIIWIEDWGFFRALAQFCGLGTLILLAGDLKVRAGVFACSGLLWVYLFERFMRHYS